MTKCSFCNKVLNIQEDEGDISSKCSKCGMIIENGIMTQPPSKLTITFEFSLNEQECLGDIDHQRRMDMGANLIFQKLHEKMNEMLSDPDFMFHDRFTFSFGDT